ncbi:NAD/NADP transhydrogenase alpha subunit [Frankia casuarinae]|uniref:proton-translocating NAD(P)(+) transhydrogenase n=1 Tax=Frankia casuarinae (strain DSM 45818 / CECT 9043 / HFP020203 / CcI3) TaxID=106370 RepID=Q2J8T8_FRACC|nr:MULTISPECIES: NAD(P) transhydrogenase subunit alpha [Frankia]ABD12304.1 alanine dehydrogenase/PNT-like [Frankia casuarinae]ETA01111.1 NAD/NADP transhydrogenase alpha subunit [Frankia sp. CcI6]EYT90915.1 NAD/NADP transhydrogenase alpha subunit [Frankia casuarinae]KEZ35708.1 NAD/NADP transhydrogenase alpha subunit [Frankia sp. CeD]KFB03162.1 NAD/NADP transhydrogenase alpha subunit [Frankia sp. Allo2]
MSPLTVGVAMETAPGERRVAMVPQVVGRLVGSGLDVLVETGAGRGAWFPDGAYAEAGATVVARLDLFARADVVVSVSLPDPRTRALLRGGQTLVGLLAPLPRPQVMAQLAEAGVTAVSLDGLPRTLSRAQSMDALTSQANVAGYKAVLVAADAYPRYFPLLMTAAGTARPAEVLVLGAGVAGLAAIGTAHRLGAVVRGYDVRPEARGEVTSLGASFLDLGGPDLGGVAGGAGQGGYARALTAEELAGQQEALAAAVARHDVVITTAQVPGRRPPLLVTEEAVKTMRPGSVVVDLAASPLGGNVEISAPDETVVTAGGVTVIGAGNLPALMPAAASAAYARNVAALLGHLVHDGALTIDTADEIQAGVVITHAGRVVHPATAALLTGGSAESQSGA